ncbi:glycosyltransferase family 39 protein [Asanoa sp. NPDC049518]|uniref:glycosyltransferase family 39 protein n=1 Tax=unclassified Asanoa TaxID=2685164 RepID=UPI00341F8DDA
MHYDQVAPVGWLWLEKTLLEVVGSDDRVIRLPACLGALAVLGLGAFIARRAIGRAGAVAVAALLAVSPSLLVYAGELMQHAFEAAVALALLVAGAWAHSAIPGEPLRSRASLVWIAVTGVAVFVSYSATLVTAAVTVALVGLHAMRRAWGDAGLQAALSAPAGLTAAFLVSWRHLFSFYPDQADYFDYGTAPEGAGPAEIVA